MHILNVFEFGMPAGLELDYWGRRRGGGQELFGRGGLHLFKEFFYELLLTL